jgi:MerR family transcriptional regulator, light-induced transcriptional regulator
MATPTRSNDETASLYPMRVVTRMTGLTSHTIRVWERRYGAVVPHRTAGNTRRYSSENVRKLTLLRQATELGLPIREVANMAMEQLEELISRESRVDRSPGGPPTDVDDPFEALRQEYLLQIEAFEYYRALEILSRAAALLPARDFVFEVVLPILRETGDRWEAGTFTVAHEHAISAQARGLLDTMQRLATPQAGSPKIVIGTPAGHRHEFGALAAAQLAVARGFEPIYLGPDVPESDLALALERGRTGLVLLAVERSMDVDEARQFDEMLGSLAAGAEVWLGLPPDHEAQGRVQGVRYFIRFEDLDVALTERAILAEGTH